MDHARHIIDNVTQLVIYAAMEKMQASWSIYTLEPETDIFFVPSLGFHVHDSCHFTKTEC